MAWEVEFTDEFEEWWNGLAENEQIKVDAVVRMLDRLATLAYARASGPSSGEAIPSVVSFNSKRTAILLVGGDKTGDDRWYQVNVPQADRLYDRHLRELKEEEKEEKSQNGQEV